MPYSLAEKEPGEKTLISTPRRIISSKGVDLVHVFPSREPNIFVDVCDESVRIKTKETEITIDDTGMIEGESFEIRSKEPDEVLETIIYEPKNKAPIRQL